MKQLNHKECDPGEGTYVISETILLLMSCPHQHAKKKKKVEVLFCEIIDKQYWMRGEPALHQLAHQEKVTLDL